MITWIKRLIFNLKNGRESPYPMISYKDGNVIIVAQAAHDLRRGETVMVYVDKWRGRPTVLLSAHPPAHIPWNEKDEFIVGPSYPKGSWGIAYRDGVDQNEIDRLGRKFYGMLRRCQDDHSDA